MKKKGVSDVKMTFVMIAMTIFFMGLFWVVLVNVFHTGPQEISKAISSFFSTLKIEKASYGKDGSISVTVVKQGKNSLDGILFTFSDDKNSEQINIPENFNGQTKKTFYFNTDNFTDISFVRNVSVTPIFTGSGDNKTKKPDDSFEFSNSQIVDGFGVLSWWNFNDDLKDSMGLSDGTSRGGVSFVDGKFGKAVRFNGEDSYVNFGRLTQFDNLKSFAISFWIFNNISTTFPDNEGIFARGPDNKKMPWIFGYKGTRALFAQFETNSAVADCSLGTDSLPARQWVHIVFQWDGKECMFYENGRLTTSDPTKGNMVSSNPSETFLGKNPDGRYFNGMVDEQMVFNKSLTDKEINALYQINLS